MSPKTRAQLEVIRDKSKRTIERAAFKTFAEHGYHSASVSLIAREAGVSKGLMYNYFDSKEALMRSLMRSIIDEVGGKLDLPKDRPLQKADVLRFIDQSFKIVLSDPLRWRLYVSMISQPKVFEIVKDDVMRLQADYVTPFIDFFASSGFPDPRATTILFHSTIDGVQMRLMFDTGQIPLESVKVMITQQFIR